MTWHQEVTHWLTQDGRNAAIVNLSARTVTRSRTGRGYEEKGDLYVDGVKYPFIAKIYHMHAASVSFEGLGSCYCPEQQVAIHLKNGDIVSERHPGLYWVTREGRTIDADEMCSERRAGRPCAFEMQCYDENGLPATIGDAFTYGVESTAVLNFIRPLLSTGGRHLVGGAG